MKGILQTEHFTFTVPEEENHTRFLNTSMINWVANLVYIPLLTNIVYSFCVGLAWAGPVSAFRVHFLIYDKNKGRIVLDSEEEMALGGMCSTFSLTGNEVIFGS